MYICIYIYIYIYIYMVKFFLRIYSIQVICVDSMFWFYLTSWIRKFTREGSILYYFGLLILTFCKTKWIPTLASRKQNFIIFLCCSHLLYHVERCIVPEDFKIHKQEIFCNDRNIAHLKIWFGRRWRRLVLKYKVKRNTTIFQLFE